MLKTVSAVRNWLTCKPFTNKYNLQQYGRIEGDNFRSVVAENIVDLFIDVKENFAIMDHVTLVFNYDTHSAPGYTNIIR